MDVQLKELNKLLSVCHSDVKDSVQRAIDERKAEIGYVELEKVGMSVTYDKMQRMVPEINRDVVFFSDEVTERLVDMFIETDIECADNSSWSDMLRSGFKGYDSYSDMQLLENYMNQHDESSDSTDLDVRVKEECEAWIAVTIEQALGLTK